MKALLCTEFGPIENLALTEVAALPLKNGEVRIRVRAAGVNFPDALVVRGKYQTRPPLPFSPGSEFAGVIAETSPEAEDFTVGDRVFGLMSFGAFAEEVVVPAATLHRMSADMEFCEAAAFCMAYGAAAHALLDRAALKSGETLLVLGAAGGVGLAAIEIAKIVGARVVAVDLSEERLKTAKAKGADAVIACGSEGLRDAMDAFTDQGADVILDTVGGALGEAALRRLAWRGRYLVFGFASGAIPKLQANLLLLRGAQAIGIFWGEFQRRGLDNDRENFKRLLAWRSEGRLKPHVGATFTLAEGARALEALERREIIGKGVITIE